MFEEYKYQVFTPSDLSKKSGLYPLWVGSLKGLPNYHCSPRVLDDHFILFVKSGRGKLNSSGKSFNLTTNDFFFLFPGVMHSYYTSKKHLLEISWISFSGFMSSHIIQELGIHPRNPIMRTEMDAARKIADLMSELIFFKSPDKAELELSGRLYQILSLVLEQKETVLSNNEMKDSFERSKPIERALSYLEKNFTTSISISDLADYVHLSRTNFSRRFKNETGRSPQDYLINLRLIHAEFLLTTPMTIKEVSHASGFSDELYFSRLFKMKKNITPSEYRKRNPRTQSGKSKIHKSPI